MTNTYFEHPAEDALERYLMHHSDEMETELVETHTLACDACVQRLEALEINIAATKLALQEIHNQEVAKAYAQGQKSSWRSWVTAPRLSFAGAALALALAVGIAVPNFHRSPAEQQVSLYDYRGQESPTIEKGRALDVHLNARGLSESEFGVELVSESGAQVWKGSAAVNDGKVEVKLPALNATGSYYFRLLNPGSQNELREFAFNVR